MPEPTEHEDVETSRPAAPEAVLVVKTTVNLPVAVVEALRELARARNTTLGKIISDAISLEQFVHDRTKEGARVVVEEPDKTRTHLWIR